MIKIKTNVPLIDKENASLLRAAELLENIGNHPNPTANEFYAQLVISDHPLEEHEDITLAAISIETMMALDLQEEEWGQPTVH